MATPTGSTPGSGSHVNSGQGGGSPPIPAATPEKRSLDTKPSFIFKTSEGVGGDADVSLPLPLAPADSPRLPMPNGSKPGVGSRQASPTFFEEIDSSSEDVQSDEESPTKSRIKAKTPDKPGEPEKKRRTPSVILETHPRLGDLQDAEFVASEEGNSGAEREKSEKLAPNLVGGATEDIASSEEVEAALDSILADYKKPTKQALSVPPSSTTSDSHSGSPATKTNAKNVANPSAATKENEPVPRSSQDTSPQSVSTSTPEASKPGSSKPNKSASATISNAVPPATPAPSSSTTPPSSARVRKLDSFTSIRSKKTEVAIDGEQSPEPEKRTKLKKSPRSEKSDRAKRRSQRMPALTLQPRYVPDTGDRDVSARSRATLEQCLGLLQLLEAGCDKELRWQLLGALVGMAFELPKKSRAEVLERSWRCARALPDAQLRQWAHQVLSRYYEAKGSDDDDSSDGSGESHNQAMQDFTLLCREVKFAATGKKWNDLVLKIARSKLGDPAKLIATAVAIDSIKGLKDKAAIGDAMSALKNKLGAKLLVLAFFQSSACPGATRLRMEIAHTASAVLRGILAGEVIGALSTPNKDGNSPFRLALMKDDAGLVFGMVRAICEDDTLAPNEKAALLSGQTQVADGIADYRETALTAYYLAVKAKYREKNPGGKIPKSKSADGSKIIYFESVQDEFDKPYAGQDQNAKQLRSEARQESLHALMSQLTANDREQLKREGQRLMREAQAGAVSAFHAALRHGKAQSVAGFIKATIEYAKSGSHLRPISFILANDASGNSALFNAMANDEASAVEAYVDAVLASALPFTDKERLLLQQGEVMAAATPKKYSPLQVAMVSLNYRAMQAYIAAVLRSSLKDDEKQQLLRAVGGNGKSAREMVAEFAQKAPQTHGKCLQTFDAMISESTLAPLTKNFLIHTYNGTSNAKKS